MRILGSLLAIISFNVWASSNCPDIELMPDRLRHLRMEVACSSENLHSCQESLLKFDPHHERDLSCRSGMVPLSPLNPSAESAIHALSAKLPREVKNVEEFFEHMRLHRARVKELGLELFRSYPKLFEGLSERQVLEVLEAHDLSKVTAGSLAPDGTPYYRALYKAYGGEIDKSIVDALNASDQKFMDEALRLNRVNTPELQRKMARLERIADAVDRGMSPVSMEEFGRPMKKASEYLDNAVEKRLALELEKKYLQVTRNLNYQGLSSEELSKLRHHLVIEERFATQMKKKDVFRLSAKVMGHTLLENGRGALSRFLGVLASKQTAKFLLFNDGLMLYFADMDRLGCSNIGHHDWVKNPNCEPAIGLTPRVLSLMNEEWPKQKLYMEYEPYTCRVIRETYEQSITAPKVTKCAPGVVNIELSGGDFVGMQLDEKKRIKRIDLRDLGRHAGNARNLEVNSRGEISKVCYETSVKGEVFTRCLEGKDKGNAKVKDLISSVNYQLQKGIACCFGNTSAGLICPK